jgi:hypothetical protein
MQAVGYSRQNPTRIVDPTGATPWFTSDSGCDSALQQSVQGCCDKLNQTLSQPGAAIIAAGGVMLPGFLSWYLLSCMHKKGFTKKPMSLRQAVEAVGNWADLCRSNSGKLNNVCIYCNWGPDRRAYPPECDPCKNAGSVANTPVPRSGNPKISSKNTDCNVFYQSPTDPCDDLLDQEHCDAVIVLCDHYQDPSQRNDICSTLYHEMIHAGGLMGPPFHEDATPAVRKHDFVYALACCICEAVYGEGASECTDCDAWRAKD